MKLIYRIFRRIFITLLIILSIWAIFFSYVIINEVSDEVDDNLEDYSNVIISRFNAGENLPSEDNGTNNSYHIELISTSYIDIEQSAVFLDEMIYMDAIGKAEPARIIKTFFRATDGSTYRLIVYTPNLEHHELIESILYPITFLFISLLIVITIINVWTHKTIMEPMYKILDWLNNYKLGGINGPMDKSTYIIEFKKLNDAIESSMTRIEKNYASQKEFIGNASHEMQTPLAICQARLEALLETDLNEEQLNEVVKTQKTIDYMVKLNKTLLLLSKIDNQQFIEKEEIALNDIINPLIGDFKEIYESKNIEVEIVSDSSLIVNMNIILAKILITNLIKNAFTYNKPFGKIFIKTDKSSFIIRNNGEAALDPNKIFERFYQNNKKSNSTGLGLALAYSICRENNFTIRYEFTENMHQFSIIF